ncbi:MAG: hypothetical protein AAF357_18745, partial [Verrucomicrobiota bacterium]
MSRPSVGEVPYARWEMVLMRVAFAVLIVATIDWDTNYTTQPKEHGFGEYVDFTFLANPDVMSVLQPLCLIGLAFYVFNLCPALALLPSLVIGVGVGTLASSQGAVGHHTQIVILTLLAQVAAHWTRPRLFPRLETERQAVHWSLIMVASAY